MGKSDPFIFTEYLKILQGLNSEKTAFLGYPCENQFTSRVPGKIRHFYDFSIGNWEINSEWSLDQKYDLIVCTRCAYFSIDPSDFVDRCIGSLEKEGHALIDWGLGDHWRFSTYKVGWVRDGEHEHAYRPENRLHSCFWVESLEDDDEVRSYWSSVKRKFDYYRDANCDLTTIVKREVPKIVSYSCKKLTTLFLWPEDPQLYILTLIQN